MCTKNFFNAVKVAKIMKRIILTFTFLVLNIFYSSAQCAMCRATVENNVSNGEAGIANGLNIGILYLFATPYLVVAVLGFLWYKKSKKKKLSKA